MALVVTLGVPLSLFSQWLSFFVSTLEALNFQPEGLANPSAEGWWPQRGDVFPYLTLHRAVSQLRRCESVQGGGGLLSCDCGGFFNGRWVTAEFHSLSLNA